MDTNTTETTMHGHGGPQGAPASDIDSKAVLTYEGWFSIHAVYGINYEKWQSWTAEKQAQALREFKGFLAELEVGHEAHTSSYALYHVAGGKGDLLFWFLQPTLEEVTDVEMKLRKLLIGAVLEPKSSFVSVIEVSNYMKFDINHPRVQARLYPKVPRLKYICFYPMSKKREVGENWYMTPREERGRMMFRTVRLVASTKQRLRNLLPVPMALMTMNGVLRLCVMIRCRSRSWYRKCALMK